MRYSEIASFPNAADREMQGDEAKRQADREDAKRRLQQLNNERLERVARSVHRELRRYLDPEQIERMELERRLRK